MLNLARLVSRPLTCLRSAIPSLPSSSSSLPSVSFSSFGQSRSLPSSSSPSTNCPSSSPLLLLQTASPLLVQSCGIKHMGKLQKRCRHCYFAIKDEQKYVMCTANPRHYAAQKLVGLKWGNMIMTHATQGGNRRNRGRGTRHMKTQASFKLEF